jgi:hypothetical protein
MLTIDKQTNMTREALKNIAIPYRPETKYWKGTQFGDFTNMLMERIEASVLTNSKGQEVTLVPNAEKWAVAGQHHTELFGDVGLTAYADGKEVIVAEGTVNHSLSVMASNSSRVAMQLFLSGRVMVCANGMFVNKVLDSVKRKQTTHISYRSIIDAGLQNYVDRLDKLNDKVDLMKSITVNEEQYSKTLISAGRLGIIAWSGLGKVDQEWKNPRHDEFKPRTAWSLYNGFTEVAKEMSPANQMRTIGGIDYALAKAGLVEKPEHATYEF